MEHLTFAFFTTEPNDVVGTVHPKAESEAGEEQGNCDRA